VPVGHYSPLAGFFPGVLQNRRGKSPICVIAFVAFLFLIQSTQKAKSLFLDECGTQFNNLKGMRRMIIANSTYKIIELVGTSEKSWEDAARAAIETAGKTLEELRIAEVTRLDVTVENGKVRTYRTRLNVSLKVQA
jgi:flavin-binding protein dodecin